MLLNGHRFLGNATPMTIRRRFYQQMNVIIDDDQTIGDTFRFYKNIVN